MWRVSAFCFGVMTLGGCGSESDVERILDELAENPWHQSAAVEDMNGDGLADIITVSYTQEENRAVVNVFVQQPGGGFAPKQETSLGTGAAFRVEDLKVSDLNLDGQPDVVVAHRGGTAAGSAGGSRISVLLKTGLGATDFGAVSAYEVGANPSRSAVGDLDLDGLPDIAVATAEGLDLLRQNGGHSGRFLAAVRVDDVWSQDVAIGDVDNDGVPDLVGADELGVRVFINDISNPGSYFLPERWSTSTWPSALTLNDFNGDGRQDFAIVFSVSDSFDRAGVSSRLQDAVDDATFGGAREVSYPEARTLFSIDSDDLDGDGRADVVVGVTNGPDDVSMAVQLASADGVLLPPVYYRRPGTSGPWRAVIGQLGPDELHDVVLADSLNGVSVHYGTGGGRFRDGIRIGE